LNNKHRLDVLSPTIKILNHSNLFYFKETGIYTVADTDIFVYSILDEIKDYPPAKLGKSKNKICLYHGVIDNSILDNGIEISKGSLPTSLFSGFDIVLAGDIHKHQILQEYSFEEKEIDEKDLETYLNNGWSTTKS